MSNMFDDFFGMKIDELVKQRNYYLKLQLDDIKFGRKSDWRYDWESDVQYDQEQSDKLFSELLEFANNDK